MMMISVMIGFLFGLWGLCINNKLKVDYQNIITDQAMKRSMQVDIGVLFNQTNKQKNPTKWSYANTHRYRVWIKGSKPFFFRKKENLE